MQPPRTLLNTHLVAHPNGAVVPADEPAVAAARADHLAAGGAVYAGAYLAHAALPALALLHLRPSYRIVSYRIERKTLISYRYRIESKKNLSLLDGCGIIIFILEHSKQCVLMSERLQCDGTFKDILWTKFLKQTLTYNLMWTHLKELLHTDYVPTSLLCNMELAAIKVGMLIFFFF